MSISATGIKVQPEIYTDLNSIASLRGEEDKGAAIDKLAKQFESIYVHMMLKSMREANAVFEEDSLFNSGETSFYRDMYDHQLALTLSNEKGIGIADAMARQLREKAGIAPELPVAKDELQFSSVGRRAAYDPAIGAAIRTSMDAVNASPTLSTQAVSVPSNQSGSASSTPTLTENHRAALANSPEAFVEMIAADAERAGRELGVEPAALVAQAALETGWGSKVLADQNGRSTFNLFNIKADSRWSGDKVAVSTLEFRNNTFTPEAANFRQYESVRESFDDYVNFIKHNPRYRDSLTAEARGENYIEHLQQAGYATDPRYAEKIGHVQRRVQSMALLTKGSAE